MKNQSQEKENHKVLTDPEPTHATSHSGVAHVTITQHVRKTWKHLTGQDIVGENLTIALEQENGEAVLKIKSGRWKIEVKKE